MPGDDTSSDKCCSFEIFQVRHKPCMKLNVTVLRGINITKGYWGDYFDTPDPYIVLQIPNSPEHRHETRVISNEANPVWNETFSFHFDPANTDTIKLHVHLMDSNYMMDESLQEQTINIRDFATGEKREITLQFYETAQVVLQMHVIEAVEPAIRISPALCKEEEEFLKKRQKHIYKAMASLLGNRAPRTEEEVPTIGMLGSGGGFRAMIAFAGVFKALVDSQILDCVSYTAGLSGSTWYMSYLYSHPDWPFKALGGINDELKDCIDTNCIYDLLTPQSMLCHVSAVIDKWKKGQPISFTDFFGHLIGDTLLSNRKECRLTEQRRKIENGDVPLPLYSCLHVKKSVSAQVFSEWVEFSPYEVGMAKYGTFMDTSLLGSKFFMGSIVKKHQEPPLHFLQGVWGSAFCILFKRLVANKENSGKDPAELMREEMEEHVSSDEMKPQDENESSDTDDDDDDNDQSDGNGTAKADRRQNFWTSTLMTAFSSASFPMLNTRSGRAGMIFNFIRGLFTEEQPVSVDAVSNGKENQTSAAAPTDIKRLYLVDSGLAFNSPYPLLLRPQRGVDILLSFDFSARPSDSTPPFEELKLAEKWAQQNGIPFPPIDTSIFDKEGMKEVYVFRDESDSRVPIVLHFPLVNLNFRRYITPGVNRQTQEDIEFANFDMFDDPEAPYSTFTFTYSNQAFDRLYKLTEFNTLLNVDLIMDIIADAVEKKQQQKSDPKIRNRI